MNDFPDPKTQALQTIPRLRAFAASLCGRPDLADDLVQETLVKAWANMASFEPGSNMMAWLFTILRNEFYSDLRKRRREVPDADGAMAARLTSFPTQDGHLEFEDFRAALFKLSEDHREALVLIGASGLSYEDAARICGCAVGTIKSRVHRAREKLAEMLTIHPDRELGVDPQWQAAADAPRATSDQP